MNLQYSGLRGHCIPVDLYYLIYKAKELEYHPLVILVGRAIDYYKLFCKQKPLLKTTLLEKALTERMKFFCPFIISLVKLSFLKKGL